MVALGGLGVCWSGRCCRQANGGSIADGRHGLKRHAASLHGPLVLLLQEQGADEAPNCRLVGIDAHHVRTPLDLAPRIKSAGKLLTRSSGLVALILARWAAGRPMNASTSCSAASISSASAAFRAAKSPGARGSGAGRPRPATAGAPPPGRLQRTQCRSRQRRCGAGSCPRAPWHLSASGPCTAEPWRRDHVAENTCRGRLQSFVRVRDDEPDAPQAATGEAAQAFGPEGLRFRVAGRHAQHFPADGLRPLRPAVGVDSHGDDHCNRDDAVVAPRFDPRVRLRRPEDRLRWHPTRDAATRPRSGGRGKRPRARRSRRRAERPRSCSRPCPHSLDERVHGPGGDTLDVASWITAVSAFSTARRGSKTAGK